MQTAAADACGLDVSRKHLTPSPAAAAREGAGLLPGCTGELRLGWSESGEGAGSKGLLTADRSSSGGEADGLGSLGSHSCSLQLVNSLPAGSIRLGGCLVLVHSLQARPLRSTRAAAWSCCVAGFFLIAARAPSWDVGFGHCLPLLGAGGVEPSPQERSPRSPGTHRGRGHVRY